MMDNGALWYIVAHCGKNIIFLSIYFLLLSFKRTY